MNTDLSPRPGGKGESILRAASDQVEVAPEHVGTLSVAGANQLLLLSCAGLPTCTLTSLPLIFACTALMALSSRAP